MLKPSQARFNALLNHLEEGVRIQSRLLAEPDPDRILQSAIDLTPFWDALAEQRPRLSTEDLAPFQARLEKLRSAADSNAAAASAATAALRNELHEMSRTVLRLRQVLRGQNQPPDEAPRTLWA